MSKSALSEPSSRMTSAIKNSPINIVDRIRHFIKNLKKTKKLPHSNDPGGLILDNLTGFSTKIVEDIMIPRLEIVALKDGAKKAELTSFFINSAHTRMPVYKDTLDDIIGYVHVKDLLREIAISGDLELAKLIRKPIIVAPTMSLGDLLLEMQKKQVHIAIVVDEFGGTAGMVTIKDIAKEILGDIYDEHGALRNEIANYHRISEDEIIANARMDIEKLELYFKQQLRNNDDEFDTVGGLVTQKAGALPAKGDVIEIGKNLSAEIIDTNDRVVKLVKIIRSQK